MSTVTVGTTRSPRSPQRRALLGLLAISIVLNLLFVAGAVWSRLHPAVGEHSPEHPYREMVSQLDLNTQQHAAFDRYVAAMRTHNEQMRLQIAPLIAGAWDKMADPQAQQAEIMQSFDQASQKWREFQRQSTEQTLDFLSNLSPAQRNKFVAIVKERRAAHFHTH